MKKCEKCNMTYTDDHNFCTSCGSPLTDMTTASPSPNAYPNTQTANSWTPIQNRGWFKAWGWLLFMILGLIFEWFISALLGFTLAGVGFCGAMASGSGVKKGVAIVLGIIALIFLIIAAM